MQSGDVLKQKKSVSLSAEIMAFNKDYKFIVLNRGERDGLELKGIYALIVSGDKVGRVKSDRIYDSMSVFDILEGEAKLVEGMEVELLLEE